MLFYFNCKETLQLCHIIAYLKINSPDNPKVIGGISKTRKVYMAIIFSLFSNHFPKCGVLS